MIFDIFTTNMTREYTIIVVLVTMSVAMAFDAAGLGGKSRRPMSTLQMLVEPTAMGLNYLVDMQSVFHGMDMGHIAGGIHPHLGLPSLDHRLLTTIGQA